jgi:hypothetical protein
MGRLQLMFMASPRGGVVCQVSGASGITMFEEVTDPANASVTLSFLRAGTWNGTDGGGSGNWLAPASCLDSTIGDFFEVRLVIDLGDNPTSGPAVGASNWHTISSTQAWTWATTAPGGLDATFTATVREIADTANSATFTGTAHTLVE